MADEAFPSESTENAEPVDAVSFFVFVLVVGCASHHWLAFTKVPYTAWLLIWGVVLGVCINTFAFDFPLLGPGSRLWADINPELLLAVFLPVLLFAGAFNLEWHLVRRLKWSGLLLAGPGVLFGGILVAILVYYTFPYDWSWVDALLFGAITSATDPVAVVAVLKEAGLPARLRTIVDLEALLNDGSAYVLFFLLRAWAEGRHQDTAQAFRVLFRLAVGGPAIGLGFGVSATLWLRYIYNNEQTEILLSIVTAFATYLVADQLVDASGVLAVVTLGLWMTAKGRHHISRHSLGPLHVVWEQLEHIANTIVFMLAGVIIAGRIYISSTEGLGYINAREYGYAVLLWVYLTVIRFLMIFLALPVLSRLGYGMNWREAIILAWGGLRGAVGLALALFVSLDQGIADTRFTVLTFFFVSASVLLTLLIQGTTTPLLLQLLGLTKPPGVKHHFLNQVLQQLEEQGEGQLTASKEDQILGQPDWTQIRKLTGLETHGLLQRYLSRLNNESMRRSQLSLEDHANAHARKVAQRLHRDTLLAEKRSRILRAVRQTYEDYFQLDYIHSGHVYSLKRATDQALDKLFSPLCDWALLTRYMDLGRLNKLLQRYAASHKWTSMLLQRTLFRKLERGATLALAFFHSHESAIRDINKYERLEDWSTEDGIVFEADDLLEKVKRNATQQVIAESKSECAAALRFLAEVKVAFPEVLQAIKTMQLAQEILLFKEDHILQLARTGLLEDDEVAQMEALVEHRLKHIYFFPPFLGGLLPGTAMQQLSIFSDIPPNAFYSQVQSNGRMCVFNPGDSLPARRSTTQLVYIIIRGQVWLTDPSAEEPCAACTGSMLGSWLSTAQMGQAWHLEAASFVQAFSFPISVLQELADRHGSVREAAWQACAAAWVLMLQPPEVETGTFLDLVQLVRETPLETIEAGGQLDATSPAFLVSGTIRSESDELLGSHCGLGVGVYLCSTRCQVLLLQSLTRQAAQRSASQSEKAASASQPQLPWIQEHATTSPGDDGTSSPGGGDDAAGRSPPLPSLLERQVSRTSVSRPSLSRRPSGILAAARSFLGLSPEDRPDQSTPSEKSPTINFANQIRGLHFPGNSRPAAYDGQLTWGETSLSRHKAPKARTPLSSVFVDTLRAGRSKSVPAPRPRSSSPSQRTTTASPNTGPADAGADDAGFADGRNEETDAVSLSRQLAAALGRQDRSRLPSPERRHAPTLSSLFEDPPPPEKPE